MPLVTPQLCFRFRPVIFGHSLGEVLFCRQHLFGKDDLDLDGRIPVQNGGYLDYLSHDCCSKFGVQVSEDFHQTGQYGYLYNIKKERKIKKNQTINEFGKSQTTIKIDNKTDNKIHVCYTGLLENMVNITINLFMIPQ